MDVYSGFHSHLLACRSPAHNPPHRCSLILRKLVRERERERNGADHNLNLCCFGMLWCSFIHFTPALPFGIKPPGASVDPGRSSGRDGHFIDLHWAEAGWRSGTNNLSTSMYRLQHHVKHVNHSIASQRFNSSLPQGKFQFFQANKKNGSSP